MSSLYRILFLLFGSDADLERLYEQWEEDDEPLPVDELPEWDPRKPQPQLDLTKMDLSGNPDDFLMQSKKGKTLMIFVRVSKVDFGTVVIYFLAHAVPTLHALVHLPHFLIERQVILLSCVGGWESDQAGD